MKHRRSNEPVVRWRSDPAELLAMLAEHGVNLMHVPGGASGFAALDIAGAIGMAHDQTGAAMLLAKYTLDAVSREAFTAHWEIMVDRQAYLEGWNRDNGARGFAQQERTQLLAKYSFSQWMDAQRCRTCKGVGSQVAQHGKVSACVACDGSGLRRMGHRHPARALEMSAEGYRKSAWPRRVQWCQAELQRREYAALGDLAYRLTSGQ